MKFYDINSEQRAVRAEHEIFNKVMGFISSSKIGFGPYVDSGFTKNSKYISFD